MKTRSKPQRNQTADTHSRRVLDFMHAHNQQLLQILRRLVEIESPSHDKQAVDHLGQVLAKEFELRGGKIHFHCQQQFGDHLQVDFSGKNTSKPLLLLGHYDTVYELGTLTSMPFRVDQGRAWGPGVFDMKSGIVFMMAAISALQELHGGLPRPLTVLLVSDEEVGSQSSRKITEALAKKSAVVLVMEPAMGLEGALKTARKGVGEYRVKVSGRASHAGLDFESGQSAILELARQIAVISNLTDRQRGITINVGVIRGGTRTNVVPAEAEAEIDARIAKPRDAAFLDNKFHALRPFNKKCRLEISGGINRPPLERTKAVASLFAQARAVATSIGIDLQETSVGGGSDGNFTAALGIPTLDGLGGVGEGAHAPHESVLLSELPRRAALLELELGFDWRVALPYNHCIG